MLQQFFFKRIVSAIILLTFCVTSVIDPHYAQAQTAAALPPVGSLLKPTFDFTPVILRGLSVDADDPMRFDFIVDTGTDRNFNEDNIRVEAEKLIKYFLAALTTPDKDQWVNLSPYEQDRIVEDNFGMTEMGRDLLAQDYILKQLMASLSDPDDKLGREFWERVYSRAAETYGSTDIPMNTFNKVWIMPDKASVYEHGSHVFVIDKHLKVMLEEDFLAAQESVTSNEEQVTSEGVRYPLPVTRFSETGTEMKDVIKNILLPELEREVNQGAHFAPLRQIYNSMILATWFKIRLKQSILGQAYADHQIVGGIDDVQRASIEQIYNQYLEAYKTGVYDMIREDYDPTAQEIIPRKYFSGGFARHFTQFGVTESLKIYTPVNNAQMSRDVAKDVVGATAIVTTLMKTPDVSSAQLAKAPSNQAMLSVKKRFNRGFIRKVLLFFGVAAFLIAVQKFFRINPFFDKDQLQIEYSMSAIKEDVLKSLIKGKYGYVVGYIPDGKHRSVYNDSLEAALKYFQDPDNLYRYMISGANAMSEYLPPNGLTVKFAEAAMEISYKTGVGWVFTDHGGLYATDGIKKDSTDYFLTDSITNRGIDTLLARATRTARNLRNARLKNKVDSKNVRIKVFNEISYYLKNKDGSQFGDIYINGSAAFDNFNFTPEEFIEYAGRYCKALKDGDPDIITSLGWGMILEDKAGGRDHVAFLKKLKESKYGKYIDQISIHWYPWEDEYGRTPKFNRVTAPAKAIKEYKQEFLVQLERAKRIGFDKVNIDEIGESRDWGDPDFQRYVLQELVIPALKEAMKEAAANPEKYAQIEDIIIEQLLGEPWKSDEIHPTEEGIGQAEIDPLTGKLRFYPAVKAITDFFKHLNGRTKVSDISPFVISISEEEIEAGQELMQEKQVSFNKLADLLRQQKWVEDEEKKQGDRWKEGNTDVNIVGIQALDRKHAETYSVILRSRKKQDVPITDFKDFINVFYSRISEVSQLGPGGVLKLKIFINGPNLETDVEAVDFSNPVYPLKADGTLDTKIPPAYIVYRLKADGTLDKDRPIAEVTPYNDGKSVIIPSYTGRGVLQKTSTRIFFRRYYGVGTTEEIFGLDDKNNLNFQIFKDPGRLSNGKVYNGKMMVGYFSEIRPVYPWVYDEKGDFEFWDANGDLLTAETAKNRWIEAVKAPYHFFMSSDLKESVPEFKQIPWADLVITAQKWQTGDKTGEMFRYFLVNRFTNRMYGSFSQPVESDEMEGNKVLVLQLDLKEALPSLEVEKYVTLTVTQIGKIFQAVQLENVTTETPLGVDVDTVMTEFRQKFPAQKQMFDEHEAEMKRLIEKTRSKIHFFESGTHGQAGGMTFVRDDVEKPRQDGAKETVYRLKEDQLKRPIVLTSGTTTDIAIATDYFGEDVLKSVVFTANGMVFEIEAPLESAPASVDSTGYVREQDKRIPRSTDEQILENYGIQGDLLETLRDYPLGIFKGEKYRFIKKSLRVDGGLLPMGSGYVEEDDAFGRFLASSANGVVTFETVFSDADQIQALPFKMPAGTVSVHPESGQIVHEMDYDRLDEDAGGKAVVYRVTKAIREGVDVNQQVEIWYYYETGIVAEYYLSDKIKNYSRNGISLGTTKVFGNDQYLYSYVKEVKTWESPDKHVYVLAADTVVAKSGREPARKYLSEDNVPIVILKGNFYDESPFESRIKDSAKNNTFSLIVRTIARQFGHREIRDIFEQVEKNGTPIEIKNNPLLNLPVYEDSIRERLKSLYYWPLFVILGMSVFGLISLVRKNINRVNFKTSRRFRKYIKSQAPPASDKLDSNAAMLAQHGNPDVIFNLKGPVVVGVNEIVGKSKQEVRQITKDAIRNVLKDPRISDEDFKVFYGDDFLNEISKLDTTPVDENLPVQMDAPEIEREGIMNLIAQASDKGFVQAEVIQSLIERGLVTENEVEDAYEALFRRTEKPLARNNYGVIWPRLKNELLMLTQNRALEFLQKIDLESFDENVLDNENYKQFLDLLNNKLLGTPEVEVLYVMLDNNVITVRQLIEMAQETIISKRTGRERYVNTQLTFMIHKLLRKHVFEPSLDKFLDGVYGSQIKRFKYDPTDPEAQKVSDKNLLLGSIFGRLHMGIFRNPHLLKEFKDTGDMTYNPRPMEPTKEPQTMNEMIALNFFQMNRSQTEITGGGESLEVTFTMYVAKMVTRCLKSGRYTPEQIRELISNYSEFMKEVMVHERFRFDSVTKADLWTDLDKRSKSSSEPHGIRQVFHDERVLDLFGYLIEDMLEKGTTLYDLLADDAREQYRQRREGYGEENADPRALIKETPFRSLPDPTRARNDSPEDVLDGELRLMQEIRDKFNPIIALRNRSFERSSEEKDRPENFPEWHDAEKLYNQGERLNGFLGRLKDLSYELMKRKYPQVYKEFVDHYGRDVEVYKRIEKESEWMEKIYGSVSYNDFKLAGFDEKQILDILNGLKSLRLARFIRNERVILMVDPRQLPERLEGLLPTKTIEKITTIFNAGWQNKRDQESKVANFLNKTYQISKGIFFTSAVVSFCVKVIGITALASPVGWIFYGAAGFVGLAYSLNYVYRPSTRAQFFLYYNRVLKPRFSHKYFWGVNPKLTWLTKFLGQIVPALMLLSLVVEIGSVWIGLPVGLLSGIMGWSTQLLIASQLFFQVPIWFGNSKDPRQKVFWSIQYALGSALNYWLIPYHIFSGVEAISFNLETIYTFYIWMLTTIPTFISTYHMVNALNGLQLLIRKTWSKTMLRRVALFREPKIVAAFSAVTLLLKFGLPMILTPISWPLAIITSLSLVVPAFSILNAIGRAFEKSSKHWWAEKKVDELGELRNMEAAKGPVLPNTETIDEYLLRFISLMRQRYWLSNSEADKWEKYLKGEEGGELVLPQSIKARKNIDAVFQAIGSRKPPVNPMSLIEATSTHLQTGGKPVGEAFTFSPTVMMLGTMNQNTKTGRQTSVAGYLAEYHSEWQNVVENIKDEIGDLKNDPDGSKKRNLIEALRDFSESDDILKDHILYNENLTNAQIRLICNMVSDFMNEIRPSNKGAAYSMAQFDVEYHIQFAAQTGNYDYMEAVRQISSRRTFRSLKKEYERLLNKSNSDFQVGDLDIRALRELLQEEKSFDSPFNDLLIELKVSIYRVEAVSEEEFVRAFNELLKMDKYDFDALKRIYGPAILKEEPGLTHYEEVYLDNYEEYQEFTRMKLRHILHDESLWGQGNAYTGERKIEKLRSVDEFNGFLKKARDAVENQLKDNPADEKLEYILSLINTVSNFKSLTTDYKGSDIIAWGKLLQEEKNTHYREVTQLIHYMAEHYQDFGYKNMVDLVDVWDKIDNLSDYILTLKDSDILSALYDAKRDWVIFFNKNGGIGTNVWESYIYTNNYDGHVRTLPGVHVMRPVMATLFANNPHIVAVNPKFLLWNARSMFLPGAFPGGQHYSVAQETFTGPAQRARSGYILFYGKGWGRTYDVVVHYLTPGEDSASVLHAQTLNPFVKSIHVDWDVDEWGRPAQILESLYPTERRYASNISRFYLDDGLFAIKYDPNVGFDLKLSHDHFFWHYLAAPNIKRLMVQFPVLVGFSQFQYLIPFIFWSVTSTILTQAINLNNQVRHWWDEGNWWISWGKMIRDAAVTYALYVGLLLHYSLGGKYANLDRFTFMITDKRSLVQSHTLRSRLQSYYLNMLDYKGFKLGGILDGNQAGYPSIGVWAMQALWGFLMSLTVLGPLGALLVLIYGMATISSMTGVFSYGSYAHKSGPLKDKIKGYDFWMQFRMLPEVISWTTLRAFYYVFPEIYRKALSKSLQNNKRWPAGALALWTAVMYIVSVMGFAYLGLGAPFLVVMLGIYVLFGAVIAGRIGDMTDTQIIREEQIKDAGLQRNWDDIRQVLIEKKYIKEDNKLSSEYSGLDDDFKERFPNQYKMVAAILKDAPYLNEWSPMPQSTLTTYLIKDMMVAKGMTTWLDDWDQKNVIPKKVMTDLYAELKLNNNRSLKPGEFNEIMQKARRVMDGYREVVDFLNESKFYDNLPIYSRDRDGLINKTESLFTARREAILYPEGRKRTLNTAGTEKEFIKRADDLLSDNDLDDMEMELLEREVNELIGFQDDADQAMLDDRQELQLIEIMFKQGLVSNLPIDIQKRYLTKIAQKDDIEKPLFEALIEKPLKNGVHAVVQEWFETEFMFFNNQEFDKNLMLKVIGTEWMKGFSMGLKGWLENAFMDFLNNNFDNKLLQEIVGKWNWSFFSDVKRQWLEDMMSRNLDQNLIRLALTSQYAEDWSADFQGKIDKGLESITAGNIDEPLMNFFLTLLRMDKLSESRLEWFKNLIENDLSEEKQLWIIEALKKTKPSEINRNVMDILISSEMCTKFYVLGRDWFEAAFMSFSKNGSDSELMKKLVNSWWMEVSLSKLRNQIENLLLEDIDGFGDAVTASRWYARFSDQFRFKFNSWLENKDEQAKNNNAMLFKSKKSVVDQGEKFSDNLGGISMDSAMLDLQRSGEMTPVKTSLPVKPVKIETLKPLIINIQFITSVQLMSRLEGSETSPWAQADQDQAPMDDAQGQGMPAAIVLGKS